MIGDSVITTPLLRKLSTSNIATFLLNYQLKLKAAIPRLTDKNYHILRYKQYQLKFDESARLLIAKRFVLSKIKTQITGLPLKKYQKLVETSSSITSLMGLEGTVSSIYFGKAFVDYGWKARLPRLKNDYLNVLLDIGYTIMFNYILALTESSGLDIYAGYLHTDYYNRPSLVCNIMESYRYIVDKVIIKVLRKKIMTVDDFDQIDGGWKLKTSDQPKESLAKALELITSEITANQELFTKNIEQFKQYVLDYNL